jgi:hypothetical protein
MGEAFKMARANRREGKRPPNRESWAGRYKVKLRYRLERPFDGVWRKILAHTVPYLDSQENTLSIPRSKAWAVIPPGTVPHTQEVVDACLAIFEERRGSLDEYIKQREKESSTYFYDVVNQDGFGERSKLLIDYMAQPAILNGVMRYLGDVPLLQGVKLFWTPKNEKMVSSQQWHLDGGDIRQLKLFLYLNDIDEGAGPLTIIPAEESRQVVKKLNYVKGKLPDDQVANLVPRDKWISLTGSAGTLVVCDTSSCFHFGGRARDGERLFLEFHYSTSAPFFYNKIPDFPVGDWKQRMVTAN